MVEFVRNGVDIIPGRDGPALSATSDMPVAKAPAVAVDTAAGPPLSESKVGDPPVTEKPATEPAPAEPVVEAVKPEPVKVPKDDKTDAAIKGEITKERNRRREAETRADQAEKERATALEALAKLTAKPAAEEAPDPRPTRDKFETPDAYEEALLAWQGRTVEATTRAKLEAEHLEAEKVKDAERVAAETKAASDAFVAKWQERTAEVSKKYADFQETVESAEAVQLSEPMSYALMNAPEGPEIAYHLAKNPDVAARIVALTVPDGRGGTVPNAPLQVFELGRFAQQMADKAKPHVSKAPIPLSPIGSRERGAEKPANEMSMEEYANRPDVKARLAADRRRAAN